MFRPSFAPPPLRTSGPADESEDEDDAAERRFHHARTLPRTPFPNMANLAIPSDDDDDEDVVVPGQRPRSSSTPGIRPGIMVPPGSSAFGSPDSGMGPIHRERGPHRPAHPAAQPTKSALRSSRRATIDHFGSFGSPPEGLQSPGPNAVFPAGVVPQLRGQQGQMYFQSPPPTAQGVGMMPNGTPFATMPRSRGMPTPMMVPQPNILPASHAHPHGQSRSRIPMQVPQPPIMTPQIMGQHHQPPPNGMPMPMPMPIYQNGMQHQQPPNTPGFPSGAPQTIPIAVTTPGYNYLPTGVPASAAGGHQWQPGHAQGHERDRDRDRERSAKRHRKHRRNRRRDDESESESESEESERSRSDGGRSSDDDHDGRRRSKRRDRSGTNPLPQPPRILPVPEVHANDAIRVDSPPAPGEDDDRPAPPPKPPPNPLPPPPKHVGSSTDGGGSTLADELAAAAEEVKRAKERTELARAKAIQRLEADTYRAAGVPIGGDEENPVVPLIAGVTVPGILPTGNASAAEEERRKKRRKHSRERSNGKRLTTGAPKEVMVFSNVKTRRRKGGHDEEGESTDEDGDDEEDERRDEGHSHNPIAAGIGSLLKRISTRNNKSQDHQHDQNGNGNGYGYGYQNGGTRRPPPPPPPPKPAPKRGALKRPTMPTHNSYDMPEEEGIVPRNAKRMVMGGNNNQPFRSQTISAANGANMIAGGDGGGGGQYPFVQPRVPGAQIPMQYDPTTQEWFDPSNGMWWNPNTRKYYHKRSTVPTVPASKHKKEGSNGGGLISMLKRWTTNTAPDHQPKPITAQLIMPGGIRRKSFQQQPVAMLANHPHAVAAQQQRGGGPRRRTISAGEMSRMGMGDGEGGNGPWYHPSANANRRMTADQMRDGSGRGRGMLPWGQHQMVDANGFPIQAAQSEMHLPRQMMGGAPPHGMVGPVDTIYFSRKRDPYGAFRLDSEHPVAWAGIEAPSAFHWYESGRFESVGKGLGASGMQTGWTRPSTQPLPSVGRGRSGSRLGHASKMLKGLLGKNDYGLKESRLEYARAHTECSDDVLRARTLRDLMRLVTQYRMEGFERNDWMMIYRSKLDEIQFLKFTQHEELGVMLLNTGFAPIIFNNQDPELGDGGDSNGAANNGRNELGHSLMRVREMLRQRRESEAEERSGGGGRGEYGDEGDYDEE